MRYDTELVFDDVPIIAAAADYGKGKPRGLYARIGRSIGVSVASGNHIAAQGTSLLPYQLPEDAAGLNRGYRFAIGFDTIYDWAGGTLEIEGVLLRDSESPLDKNRELSDVRFRIAVPETNNIFTLAWAKSWDTGTDTYRVFGEIPVTTKMTWEPYIRFEDLQWSDFGLTLRLRL